MKFCRKIDEARSRRYDIYKLLSCEILENSYLLTKECCLRKPDKHELVHEICYMKFQQILSTFWFQNTDKKEERRT